MLGFPSIVGLNMKVRCPIAGASIAMTIKRTHAFPMRFCYANLCH